MTLREKWLPRIDGWRCDADRHLHQQRWMLDFDALADALDVLGVTWELSIAAGTEPWSLGAYHTGFCHNWWAPPHFKNHDQLHILSFRPELSPEAASMCLWHELTHAKQAEDFGDPWAWYESISAAYEAASPGSPEYFALPVEVEAFENMECHYTVGSLAVPT